MKTNIMALGLASLLVLSACSAKEEEKPKEKEESIQDQQSNYPVTLPLNEEMITIEKEPQKIVPLSLDVAEIVFQLTDASRIVAVSKGIEDPYLSSNPPAAKEVSQRVASAVHIDPEQILSFDTDLLLLTKMHGQEQDAYDILQQAKVPILAFETMGTMKSYRENMKIIGKAIGLEERANEVVAEMEQEISKIINDVDHNKKPSVLVLSEVGPGTGPYMMGPGNISYDILQQAGAVPAVDLIGLDRSTKATIEQVVKMNPDYILFLDWQGDGEKAYGELLDTPIWQTLDAVKNNQTKIIEAKYVLNPNGLNVEGLKKIVGWLYR